MIDELEADPSVAFNAEWIGQDPTTDPVLAAYFLFHDCDLVTLCWALGTLRAFLPRRAYAEPIALAAEIPSTYIVASLDRTILPGWSHRAARERLGIKAVELDAGHCPHVSRADELAELLTAS